MEDGERDELDLDQGEGGLGDVVGRVPEGEDGVLGLQVRFRLRHEESLAEMRKANEGFRVKLEYYSHFI